MARHPKGAPKPQSAPPPPAEAPEAAPADWSWLAWGLPLGAALATLVVFWPNVHHAFLDWDDNHNFIDNRSFQGLDFAHLTWIFVRSVYRGNYEPLHWLAMALIHSVWGLAPGPYHAYGVLFHAMTAGVFYLVCEKLLAFALPEQAQASPEALRLSAACAALLFALHPLRVEVVSWASGMHYIPAAFWGLVSIWGYLRAYEARGQEKLRRSRTLGACGALALSMLSFPLWMAFPFALLAIDVYPLRRLSEGRGRSSWSALLREKWPYVLVAGLGAWMMLFARQFSKVYQGLTSLAKFGVLDRAAESFYGLAVYVLKTLVPYRLCPLYEVPANMDPFAPVFLLCAAGVTAGAVLLYAFRRRAYGLWPVFAFYAVTVAPVLGITQSGPQLAADRYTYIPCLGFPVIAGWALLSLWRTKEGEGQARFKAGLAACALAVAALAFLTRRYVAVWENSESLWDYALTIDPHMSYANNNKGNALSKRGELREAIKHYKEAIAAKPDDANPYYNMGLALFDQGKYQDAIDLYRQALKLNPLYADCHAELGVALKNLGRLDEAVEEYHLALRIEPGHVEAMNSLGVALASQGRYDEAIEQFKKALAANPLHAKSMTNWGNALSSLGRLDDAEARYRDAVRADPGYADAHNNLGDALAKQGKYAEAAAEFQEALRLNPNYRNAKSNLARLSAKLSGKGPSPSSQDDAAQAHHVRGLSLAREGKMEEALKEFQETVRLSPGFAAARNNLGASYARLGKPAQAAEEYRAALRLQPDYPDAHNNLGMALANEKKWDEAVAEFKEALRLNPELSSARANLDQVYKITGRKP